MRTLETKPKDQFLIAFQGSEQVELLHRAKRKVNEANLAGNPMSLKDFFLIALKQFMDDTTDDEFLLWLKKTYPVIYEKTIREIQKWLDDHPDCYQDPEKRRKFILTRFRQAAGRK